MNNEISSRFELLDLDDERDQRHDRRDALSARQIPSFLGNHRKAAKDYKADQALVDAVNTALAVGAPLLLTGEPGTGKTQVAYFLAWYFHLEDKLFKLHVRSTTTAEELLYSFDAVAYLHASNDPNRNTETIKKGNDEFLTKGPLWKAFKEKGPSIVLIDEIDKASRDFPNDLLNVLDQHEFTVVEKDEDDEDRVVRRGEKAPPLVVITSNSERRLPEPFLRRCVFHHIELSDELVKKAVEARVKDFPDLSEDVRGAAIAKFFQLRGLKTLRKAPATAELLVWLAVLNASGDVTVEQIRDVESLAELPALGVLIKDRDDQKNLGRR